MTHKILTNQIMLSPTEGYLSPCPFLPLSLGSLCSLPLPIGNKESLGQITPLHMVTLGPTFPYNTNIVPESQEEEIILKDTFLTQSAPDISKKLQKLVAEGSRDLDQLVHVATSIY
jgi:hypothetical protein